MFHVILGKGFVGNHLAQYFRANNIEHRIFSQSDLDYTDPDKFREFIEENDRNIKTVINCSGYTGVPNVDACEDNKELCYNYNVLYPLNVVKMCNAFSIPVIHIGSGCIYSGYDKEYTENDTPNFGMFSNESSYYSKCKHVFETFAKNYKCYVLRIRIPFTDELTRKNYFAKLLGYDTLINELNSVTSLNDFNEFIVRFIATRPDYGIYNVVNPEPVKAEEVVWLLEKHGLKNLNWRFISLDELNTKANRSNCVLSTEKLKRFGLELPNTRDSLVRDIVALARSQGQDV
jgi:dTDP-4-dehydrorhamnose reductase